MVDALPDGRLAPSDGGVVDGGPVAPGNCPRSRSPACALGICSIRQIATPAAPEYPFAIATDVASVYWLAQAAGDTGTNPYDGSAPARVLRHSKAGPEETFEIAVGQAAARTMVIDGAYLYWNTYEPTRSGHPTVIRRARRDCAKAPCVVEDVVALDGNVDSLVRGPPGILVGVTGDNGAVFVVDTTASPAGFNPSATQANAFPSLAATNDAVYVSSLAGPASVKRLDFPSLAVTAVFAKVPASDAGSGGVSPVASDCDVLWGSRPATDAPTDFYGFAVDGGGVVSQQKLPALVFAMVTDARYVYFAVRNVGGVFAFDKQFPGNSVATIASGNVWWLAVDDDGVYWGEHGQASPGAIFMLVK